MQYKLNLGPSTGNPDVLPGKMFLYLLTLPVDVTTPSFSLQKRKEGLERPSPTFMTLLFHIFHEYPHIFHIHIFMNIPNSLYIPIEDI